MALRKPLVIIAGVVQQISTSDTLDATVSEKESIVKVNGNAGAVVCGMAVYVKSATQYDKAQANAAGTAGVLGLQVEASVAAAGNGTIQTSGVLTLTTAQWDAVAGTTGGLAFGTVYYLDPTTPGKITATAPTTVGQYVVPVGRALSTTELDILMNPSAIVLL